MEDVIQGACWHIDVFGSHVFGHYDLLDPNGDNILPQDWETVIQPDWTITTHMWPIPVNQKDADPAPAGDSQLMRPQLHRSMMEVSHLDGRTWLPSETLCGISRGLSRS